MRLSALAALALLLALAGGSAAEAQTTLYKAICKDSSFKDAQIGTDLSKVAGAEITCLGVTVSQLANKRINIQFLIPGQSVLGFSGDGLDAKSNPGLITLPLKRLYLPGRDKSDTPMTVEGIDGFCFLDGKDIRSLTGIICIAKLDSGSRRQIYEVNSHLQGAGQTTQLGAPAKKP